MKKIMKICLPIAISIIVIVGFNSILDKKIQKLSSDRDMSNIRHNQGVRAKYNGSYFRDLFLENNDLMLLGSSELGSNVPQNPVNLFPFNEAEYEISNFGVAHIQNLQHATMVGGSDKFNEDSKLGLIVSLQWFEDENGMQTDQFLPGFSEVQFYQFLDNPKISIENKKYLSKRVYELISPSNMFTEEGIYAKLFLRETPIDKVMYYLTYPYFKSKKYMLETRDKIAALKELKNMPEKEMQDTKKTINFEEEYKLAEEQGQKAVTNNRFYAEDNYYNTYLKDIEADLADRNKNVDIMNSVEFKDFEFFLDLCNDLEIKPYIILMNVNGWYYDYTGITEGERIEFYNKLESIATEKGFDVLNLQPHEYEKYYLIDVMHLGWKGWLNVTEEMYNYFKK
ncbi:MAG: D-alanyl-lipoteichoic acid biosynthesis protein DltD [Clostridium sp.]